MERGREGEEGKLGPSGVLFQINCSFLTSCATFSSSSTPGNAQGEREATSQFHPTDVLWIHFVTLSFGCDSSLASPPAPHHHQTLLHTWAWWPWVCWVAVAGWLAVMLLQSGCVGLKVDQLQINFNLNRRTRRMMGGSSLKCNSLTWLRETKPRTGL